ncbi:MAG: TolB family protein [Bacteroidia bacterium]
MLKSLLLFLIGFNCCLAQLPNTDLWLFPIKNEKENYSIAKGENITNRPGYDNQPAFSEDGSIIYYVSIREDKQADIYTYNIGNKKIKQFTNSKISEYSPTLTPDKKIMATVAVLEDSSQVVYPLDIKTGTFINYPDRKFEDVQLNSFDSVGYFTFLNADTVLYYKLTQPHTLRARSLSGHTDIFIAENPVRGFKAISRNEFIFGIKDSAKVTFYRYNIILSKAFKYCDYNSTSEDILWHKQFGLLKSEGPQILRFKEKENKWETLFDFSSLGITKITRFAFDVSNKKIVLVNNIQ